MQGANLQPGARGRHVHSALGAVGWGGGVCVLASVEAELGQLVACTTPSHSAPRSRCSRGNATSALTVRSLEFEGLAVLVGDGVGGGVERHASGENERLGSNRQKSISVANGLCVP